jgi:ferritin-like metal-binding protein YciE
LDEVFKKLGQKPSGTDCPAIDGLIKEADEMAGEVDDKSVLDAAIVANAQAVEHYEISRYGTLIAWAEELGHDDIVRFLPRLLAPKRPLACPQHQCIGPS